MARVINQKKVRIMKKFIYLSVVAMMALAVGFSSCSSCESKKKGEEKKESPIKVVGKLNVENAISTDREYMYLHYRSDYRWFETSILLKDFIDADSEMEIESLSNVFQVIEPKSGGYDTHVIFSSHTSETVSIDENLGFWIEDFPLNEQAIKISFEEAYSRMMEANLPKPHSRHCVLRKEVGPKVANPQYIFGNVRAQVYVDAVTGDVSDKNPVFDVNGFKMPLGEWP